MEALDAAGLADVLVEVPPPADQPVVSQIQFESLEAEAEMTAVSAEVTSEEGGELWGYRLGMLMITICWASNFPIIKFVLDELGNGNEEGSLFVAARFGVAGIALLPFLASASSMGAVLAGAQVGLAVAFGYAAQAAALSLGASANKVERTPSLSSAP